MESYIYNDDDYRDSRGRFKRRTGTEGNPCLFPGNSEFDIILPCDCGVLSWYDGLHRMFQHGEQKLRLSDQDAMTGSVCARGHVYAVEEWLAKEMDEQHGIVYGGEDEAE